MRSGSITFPSPTLQLLGSEEDGRGGGGDSSALIGGFSVEQVGFLWGSLVLQLRRGIFDDRVEIRQSCIKTFFALLTTHGTTSMPASAWDVSFWMVLVRLSAMLSSCNQQPQSKVTFPTTASPSTTTNAYLSPTSSSSSSQALHKLLCGGYLSLHKDENGQTPIQTPTSSSSSSGTGEERFFPHNGIPLTSPTVTTRLLTKLIGDTKARCELQVSLLEPIARCLRLFNTFLLVPLDGMKYDYSIKATFAQLDGDEDSDLEQPHNHKNNKNAKRLPVSEFPLFLDTVLQFAGSCVEQEVVSGSGGGGGSGNGGEVMLISSTKAILTILGDYWGQTLPVSSWEEAAVSQSTVAPGSDNSILSSPTGSKTTRYVLSSMSVAGAWRVLEKACGTHPSASNGTLTTTVAGLWDLIQSAMHRCNHNNTNHGGGVVADPPRLTTTASSVNTSLDSSMVAGFQPTPTPTSVVERDSAFTQSVPFSSFFSLLGHVLQSNVVKSAYFFPAPPQQSVLDTLTLLIKHITTSNSSSTQLQDNIGVVQGGLSVVLDTFPTETYFRETADYVLLAVIEVPFDLPSVKDGDNDDGGNDENNASLKTLRDLVKSLPVSEKDRKARLASTFSPIGSHPKFLLTVLKTLEGQLLPLLHQVVKSSLPQAPAKGEDSSPPQTGNNAVTHARALKNSKMAQVYQWCVSTVVTAAGVFVVSTTLLQFALVSLRTQRGQRMANMNTTTNTPQPSVIAVEYSYTKDVASEALQQFIQIIHQVGALHSTSSFSTSPVEVLLIQGVRERLLQGVVHALLYFNSLLEHLLSYCAEGGLNSEEILTATPEEGGGAAATTTIAPSLSESSVRPLLDLHRELVQTATTLRTAITSSSTRDTSSISQFTTIRDELKIALEASNDIVVEFGTWLPKEDMIAVNKVALDQLR